jgi:hypothetical protein
LETRRDGKLARLTPTKRGFTVSGLKHSLTMSPKALFWKKRRKNRNRLKKTIRIYAMAYEMGESFSLVTTSITYVDPVREGMHTIYYYHECN